MKRWIAAACVGALALTGCAGAQNKPLNRPVGVLTTLTFTTSDPAYAADEGSDTLVDHVYQRLLTMKSGTTEPKPDAAQECKFIDELTYTCTLKKGLSFSNGQPVTSDAVKFSIERAKSLAKPGTPGRMFDTIDSVEVKSPRRVDFHLTQPDRNLASALASPAGAIVFPVEYPTDGPRGSWQMPIGSGPFILEHHDLDQVRLARNPGYSGPHWTATDKVILYSTGDAGLADRLLSTDRIDVLWGAGGRDGKLVGPTSVVTYPQGEQSRLMWNPTSPQRSDAALRAYVRDATAPLRTHRSNNPLPNQPQPDEFAAQVAPVAPGPRTLTLGFRSRDQRAVALAAKVRDEIQKAPGVRVTLAPDAAEPDLTVTFDRPSTASLLPTLQPWWDFPLPESRDEITRLIADYRRTPDEPSRQRVATELLRLAERDAVLMPLTQTDQIVVVREGFEVDQEWKMYAGPNHQLGAWSLKW